METISIIGIIRGVVVMVYLAWKGVSIYLIAPAASLVVIITSRIPVLDTLTNAYLPACPDI
jgi:H+/gluconate symporter-like permease